jgi:hypothetical protein
VIGIIDESTPVDRDGRVVYALALVLIDGAAVATVAADLRATLRRSRPFHWERDRGGDVRRRMIDQLINSNVRMAFGASVCDPRGQSAAREVLLDRVLFPVAYEHSVSQLWIEQRSRNENLADGRTVRNWWRPTEQRIPNFVHVDKQHPLAWLADIGSGVWSDALLGRSGGSLERLVAGRVVLTASFLDP